MASDWNRPLMWLCGAKYSIVIPIIATLADLEKCSSVQMFTLWYPPALCTKWQIASFQWILIFKTSASADLQCGNIWKWDDYLPLYNRKSYLDIAYILIVLMGYKIQNLDGHIMLTVLMEDSRDAQHECRLEEFCIYIVSAQHQNLQRNPISN